VVVAPVVAPLRPTVEPDDDGYLDDLDDAGYAEERDAFWAERRRPRVDPSTLSRKERRAYGRLRARKVRRIVRHVSPWSVFKMSILSTCACGSSSWWPA
jgi:hypothetical protein